MMLKPANMICALVFALALGATAARAQECPPNGASVDGVTDKLPELKKDAQGGAAAPVVWPDKIEVQLGFTIYVHIKQLGAFLECQKKLQPVKNIVLFLAQNQLGNVVGMQTGAPDKDGGGFLRFTLVRTTPGKDVKDAWVPILGRPWLSPKRDIAVSVGLADQYPINSSANPIDFRTVPQIDFTIALVFFAVLLGCFGYAVYRSNILRDATTEGAGGTGAFSLSKTQAAVWFFVILGSYMLIAAVTGEFNGTLTATALTLIGIGAATSAGSAIVSASQDAGSDVDKQKTTIAKIKTDLDAKRTYVAALSGPLVGTIPTEGAIKKAQAELDSLELLYKKATNQSIGFINDILSDANGINFHRFQMVGWTLVLSFIFIKEVWEKLGMPDFDGNLLALQGISAATFVGLKLTEPTVPNQPKT